MISSSRSSETPISLNSLPDDLLVEISSCVGASSYSSSSSFQSGIYSLQRVSKAFQRFCNDPYVFRRLSPFEVRSYMWSNKRSQKFMKCVESGNPEALYQQGLGDYFYHGRQDRGIEYLSRAANEGNHPEAKYVYGMISLCFGGEIKEKGFEILSSLFKHRMSDTMEEMNKFRLETTRDIWWRGEAIMRQLKGNYVRESCNCDGRTEKFMQKCIWDQYKDNMVTSSACEICLWHHELQLFFDNN